MNYVLDLTLNAVAGAVVAAVLGVFLARIPGVHAWLLAQSPARIALMTFLATALVFSGVFIAYINRVSGRANETELEFLNKMIEPASHSLNEARMAGDFGNDNNKNWFECGKHARIAVAWATTTKTKLTERRDLLVRAINP